VCTRSRSARQSRGLLHDGRLLAPAIGETVHFKAQVGPVEPLNDLHRPAHLQLLDDLRSNRGCGGRGQRDHPRRAQALHDVTDPEVVGPEVVPPGGHAVRFIDGEQRDPGLRQPVDDGVIRQLLRRQEDELGGTGAQRLPGVGGLLGSLCRVHRHRLQSGFPTAAGRQARELVSLQRDQRGHDDRGAIEQQTGQLVDGGLPGPGGHHDEDVGSLHQGSNRLRLTRAELSPAEMFVGGPANGRRNGSQHPRFLPCAGPSDQSELSTIHLLITGRDNYGWLMN